jgi:hypothetical protein
MLAFALLLALARPAHALELRDRVEEYTVTAADALVVRPVLLAATLAGAGIFVAGLPFFIGADPGRGFEMLVAEPARAAFTRCLGCEPGEIRGF